jgi:addiction module HigA family antidote
MLFREFLEPMHLSQQDLARRIGVPYQRINELVNQRRGVTPSTALRLAQFFGNSPAFWLNLQLRWDLYHAQAEEADALRKIRPIGARARLGSESSMPYNHSLQGTAYGRR